MNFALTFFQSNKNCANDSVLNNFQSVSESRNCLKFYTFCIMFLVMLIQTQSPASALEQEVAVLLFKAHQPLHDIVFKGPAQLGNQPLSSSLYKLVTQTGKLQLYNLRQKAAPPLVLNTNRVVLKPVGGIIQAGVDLKSLRHYRGSLTIVSEQNSLSCLNELSMRDYITSVVGSETLADFPVEALKAQAVLIQTSMRRYKLNDELNDSTEKHAYLGADYERPQIKAAVQQTWGQSLTYNNRPVETYFHSTCAGKTSSSEIFNGKKSAFPYDVSVDCEFCKSSPFWQETKTTISKAQFAQKIAPEPPKVITQDSAERPLLVSIQTKDPNNHIDSKSKNVEKPLAQEESGYSLWLKVGQQFGWDKLPGLRYRIEKQGDETIVFKSTGAGHGVGMCQWGAAGQARLGKSYKQILTYYFPGTTISGSRN